MIQIFLSLFILSGLVADSSYEGFRNILIVGSTILIFLLSIRKKRSEFTISFTKLDIMYYFFLMFCLQSSFFHGEFFKIYTTIQYFLYYLIFVICFRNVESYSIYLRAFLSAQVIVLLVSYYESPIVLGLTSYKGIYINPNTFGMFAAMLCILSVGLLLINLKKKNKKIHITLLISLFVMSFYLVMISASRTALLGVVLSLSVVFLSFSMSFLLYNKLTLNTFRKLLVGTIIISIIIIIIVKSPIYIAFENNIISKFVDKGSNLTSGRTGIWLEYLSNTTFFGTKANYLFRLVGYSAHNSFIDILGQFGIFAGIFYFIFWLWALFKSFIFCVSNYKKDTFSIIALLSVSLFVIMSTMETLINAPTMYLALTAVGYINLEEKKQKKLESI